MILLNNGLGMFTLKRLILRDWFSGLMKSFACGHDYLKVRQPEVGMSVVLVRNTNRVA